jgi:hypothetical protein
LTIQKNTPEEMTESLAESVLGAVANPKNTFRLRDWYRDSGADVAGLAAVRVLGPDMLTPFVLHGRRLDDADVRVVASAVRAYPAPADTEMPLVWEYRDWALTRLLAEHGDRETDTETDGATDNTMPPDTRHVAERPWARRAMFFAQLSALALPGLASPLRAQAVEATTDLERGLVRSMLRRDHWSSARLARWLAMTGDDDAGLSLASALDHLEFLAVGRPRVLLEIAVARLLLSQN